MKDFDWSRFYAAIERARYFADVVERHIAKATHHINQAKEVLATLVGA